MQPRTRRREHHLGPWERRDGPSESFGAPLRSLRRGAVGPGLLSPAPWDCAPRLASGGSTTPAGAWVHGALRSAQLR
eukprot:5762026-Alexandrium_andersonii.AAC.1